MARLLKGRVITNSVGFEEREFNELSTAQLVARHLNTEHHETVVRPNITQVLRRIAWHFDEPLADSGAVAMWYVCEATRRQVTVALSGDGGDEGFGGYTFRYLPHMLEARVRATLPPWLRQMVFGTLGRLWPASARLPRPLRLKTILENLAVSDSEAFYRDLIWLRGEVRSALYSKDFLSELRGFVPFETAGQLYRHSDAPDALGRSQATDIDFYMTDDVLAKVDRMSMAHSLEVRAPLLDHRVLEFAAGLPAHLKVAGRVGKLPLRKLASRHLPREVLEQPKRGFSIPAAGWLRENL